MHYQGAEAIVEVNKDVVIKDRIKKEYRHPKLDLTLRKSRTKREAKILKICPVPAPRLIRADETTLALEFISGAKVRDILNSNTKICKDIGETIAKLHDNGIIHGDLTTSNMIFKDKIYLIDFGLSYISDKMEDKAVDIHLFRQALESKHHKILDPAFKFFLQGYKKSKNYNEVMSRFKKVEARGRNKNKGD